MSRATVFLTAWFGTPRARSNCAPPSVESREMATQAPRGLVLSMWRGPGVMISVVSTINCAANRGPQCPWSPHQQEQLAEVVNRSPSSRFYQVLGGRGPAGDADRRHNRGLCGLHVPDRI